MDFRMNALEAPHRVSLLVALALALTASGCDDPDQFLPKDQVGSPKGVLDGTVTYAGPLPCTANDRIVGAAVLLVFDVRRLPPPEGIGTAPTSLAVVSGETLFAGVRGRLTFNSDKSLWCPPADILPVTVSATWAAAPLDGGTYQVRGFYDLDGNFDPAFSITNLPTRGDIAGGAIDNTIEALAGKPPVYRAITLGTENNGVFEIPAEGARISGVTVSLGLQIPIERPLFFPSKVTDMTSAMNTDPRQVTMPSDFQLATFSTTDPIATEGSLIRLTFGAGVAPEEAAVGASKPFNLPTQSPSLSFIYTRQDVNGDGIIDANSGSAMSPDYLNDHIPDSHQIPALFPLAIFTKLKGASDPGSDVAPTILIQGITIYKTLLETAFAKPDLVDPQPEVTVAIRPAALCIPADLTTAGALVVTHETDSKNNAILADESEVQAGLEAQFKRPMEIIYGCLPEGLYAMSLIYSTGQAWTVPNEAGVCASSEPPTPDGTACLAPGGTPRARLASQAATLTIGPPTDPAACPGLPAACLALMAPAMPPPMPSR
jgi:hypothetical protein